MKINIFKNKWIIAILAMIVIILSGYALTTIIYPLQFVAGITALLLLLPIFNYFFEKPKINVYNGALLIIVGMIGLAAIVHFKQGSIMYYALFGCFIITAFGLTLIYSFKRFVKLFLHIMTGVTIVALLGYILVNYVFEKTFLPTASNTNNIEFAIGIIFYSITIIPERNCGIFWEPGLFATFLTLAIIFELLFKEDKPNIFRIILFSLAIITAHSSAGYVIWALSMLLWLLQTFQRKVNEKVAKWIIISCAVLGGVGLLSMDFIISHTRLAENQYFQKLLFENLFSSLRMKALVQNIELFFSEPLLGVGTLVLPEDAIYFSDTATATYMLRIFGILGIVYIAIWVYGILKIKDVHIISRTVLLVIMICIINKEPHMFNLFSWIFMFYLLKNSTNTLKKNAMNAPLYKEAS